MECCSSNSQRIYLEAFTGFDEQVVRSGMTARSASVRDRLVVEKYLVVICVLGWRDKDYDESSCEE